MESWENKILSDKLNSLQDFPADYAPDLSSKWEIIDAGLPQKSKRRIAPVLIRWSVAAAILVSFFLVWVKTNEKENNTVAVLLVHQNKSNSNLIITPKKQELQAEIVIPSIDKNASLDKEISVENKQPANNTASNLNSERLGQQKELILSRDSLIPQLNPPLPQTNVIAQLATDTFSNIELATAATVEKIKPVKKRIYQRDFNDGALVMDTGFSPSATQHFGIRLLPFSKKVNKSSEQPIRRLQWKTSL